MYIMDPNGQELWYVKSLWITFSKPSVRLTKLQVLVENGQKKKKVTRIHMTWLKIYIDRGK